MRFRSHHFVWLGLLPCLFARHVPFAHAASGSATIYWTAPGDDSTYGRATQYDMRYSLAPITAANFLFATRVSGMATPKAAGTPESFTVTNLIAGTGYYFAIKTMDDASNWSAVSNDAFLTIGTTAVRNPLVLWLSPPSPNPARAAAHWSYTLPAPGPVDLEAFDLDGRRVASIANGWRPAGEGEATWDLRDAGGRNVAPGVYLIRASFGGQTSVKRLVVAR